MAKSKYMSKMPDGFLLQMPFYVILSEFDKDNNVKNSIIRNTTINENESIIIVTKHFINFESLIEGNLRNSIYESSIEAYYSVLDTNNLSYRDLSTFINTLKSKFKNRNMNSLDDLVWASMHTNKGFYGYKIFHFKSGKIFWLSDFDALCIEEFIKI